jgi:hypothetical protein
MKQLFAAALIALASPVLADNGSDLNMGQDLMKEGAQLLLRGLMDKMMDEAGPTIETMQGLAKVLGDLDQYYPPEVLPNGDVILRRKTPLNEAPGTDL